MKRLMILILFFSTILAACSTDSDQNELSTQELKDLVHDYSTDKKTAEAASISSSNLVITEEGKEVTYDLSKNDFFVSIAPYEMATHPCENHSLTGCQGEMRNQEFDLYIEDTDGNVIVDKTINSFDNGFIDLWLPRNKTYKTKIEYNGKVAESDISTFDKDGTCITTMQLI
ncbi:hypothetical protein JCM21714_4196 [Gracilibacillus boraciitolerans JCM 21714]|uniref:Lipoprotein n=1 Tax=Gracilibacillus boraciitolerans JCM 21714 TaxID=1298598 RepID=W4VQ84_9BACI|nr:CueP family metal-binding protein [Gracilibacillus boraciitolerans]GAE94993.1 hypothetical protein JCM21714_4196 [Gracilibacillus boraciitolerans JCM 21714]